MPDIIHLLPDAVANQIAAGEVIQRPASAVKELLENAIDAGAENIRLLVKEAGRTLIQVADDGCGMSEGDALLCFSRHATSKIKKAEDLFAIRSMGFRGEALASIAAIARVEMKTRRIEDEVGTFLLMEGSELRKQESCQCPAGTAISVKNLFFNVPARRNFLKSNSVEMRHIIEEFLRVALSRPDLFFSLHHDEQEVFHLPKATLKQRIVHVFGNNYSERLVPVEEDTNIIRLNGFVGKPSYARKTRGEQYFFVNNRFVRDPYLHHAVLNAFQDLIPEGSFPFYLLFIRIDPARIDVNVHPTKTEIKFEDEKPIYAILRSAIKRSLGQYNIAPSLDFGLDQNLVDFRQNPDGVRPPVIQVNPDYNPFRSGQESGQETGRRYERHRHVPGGWEELYSISRAEEPAQPTIFPREREETDVPVPELQPYQLHQRYILSPIKSGCIVVDQQAAHERILYERYIDQLESKQGASQQNLFPKTVELSAADMELIRELQEDIRILGFDFREFGKNTIVVEGTPADIPDGNEDQAFEQLIESFKQHLSLLKLDKRSNLARSLAKNASVKAGTVLSREEMNRLIDELFACKMPKTGISGKPTFITIGLDELTKRFEKI